MSFLSDIGQGLKIAAPFLGPYAPIAAVAGEVLSDGKIDGSDLSLNTVTAAAGSYFGGGSTGTVGTVASLIQSN